MKKVFAGLLFALLLFSNCRQNPTPKNQVEAAAADSLALFPRDFEAKNSALPLRLDGVGDDACWQEAAWHPMEQRWIGPPFDAADFSGRYKLAWDETHLYVLAEITDDSLVDTHADGLLKYWDDDCLEFFVDEDASGGIHQYSHNAFAYHIALDGRVTDIGPDSLPHFYDGHCLSKRMTMGKLSVWEVALKIFPATFDEHRTDNQPLELVAGKNLGFAIAYCDNDRSPERENFIGSVFVPGADKNRGWIDAGIFGRVVLK